MDTAGTIAYQPRNCEFLSSQEDGNSQIVADIQARSGMSAQYISKVIPNAERMSDDYN
jgi:hypothetical protein